MKKRFLTTIAAILCILTVFSAGVAPVMAYAPPSGEGDAVVQAEEVRWYFRDNNGVLEKRLWSLTYQHWITAWIPA